MRTVLYSKHTQLLLLATCSILLFHLFVRDIRELGVRKHVFGPYEESLFNQDLADGRITVHNTTTLDSQSWPATEASHEHTLASSLPQKEAKVTPDEVVLILKTGQSTPADRLRAQLETFASAKYGRNPGNTMIISDAAHTIDVNGVLWEVIDVLDDLSGIESVANSNKFKVYRAQKESFASGENTETLDPPGSNNDGWSLDAFKFLPGYKRAAEKFPHAKWFIGLDDDNYLFWDSLLEFLALLDHEKRLYIGSPSILVANNVKFIHGGSVTISSRAAVKARFIDHAAGLRKFHEAAVKFCCGDAILAMAYADLKIMPNDHFKDYFNGEPIENTRVQQHQFCKPLLGLHHLTGDNIRELDQEWDKKRVESRRNKHAVTTWGTYLERMTRSMMSPFGLRNGWDFIKVADNTEKIAVIWMDEKSPAVCQSTCEANSTTCLAWTYEIATEECWLSPSALVGHAVDTQISAVNLKRLEELQQACAKQDWRQTVKNKAIAYT